jgi:CNT family concentrative nucleoside transporter
VGLWVNVQALISSCVMSIPASLAVSKMRYPETEETLTGGSVVIPDEDHGASNALHTFAAGAWLGLKIRSVIVVVLLCLISLLGLVNGLLIWWGRYLNINDPL